MIWFNGLSTLWKAITAVLVAIAAIWVLTFVYDLVVGSKDVEAKLGTNQAGAAIESGTDAVETVGNQQGNEAQIEDDVEDIQDAVDEANDSAGADAAGRNGLCQQFGVGCEE